MKKIFILCACCAVTLALIKLHSVLAQEQKINNSERPQFKPKQIKVDANYDGLIDRVEIYDEKGEITKLEIDTIGKGKINEWVYYEGGKPKKA